MKKTFIFLCLLAPLKADAALSNFWATAGGFKMARQDRLPHGTCSTCTITRNWDGDTISLFGSKNETLGFALYMANATGSDIADVSVTISSFTGPTGYGIVSTPVLLPNVTDYTTRPIEVFYVRYLQIKGMTQLSWDGSEVDQRDLPERFQRPCTVNGNGACVATGGTVWEDRRDHDKFYPEILVPYEAIAASSFTVSASSSQAIWFDVYLSTSLRPGTYTGSITVREGVVVSTTIPVEILLYNATLPDSPSLKAITYMSSYNLNYRHQNEHFPSGTGNPYRRTRDNYAKFLRRHKLAAIIGDDLVNNCGQSTKYYPCPEYVSRLDGSLYTAAEGYGNAPGYGLGEEIYSIGTYSSWDGASWSTSTVAGSTGFCTAVSSWSAYFNDNFPNVKAFLYLQDEPADLSNVNKWSTWMSTACTMTKDINAMVTASAVDTFNDAPYVDMPVSTTFLRASSATWQSTADYYQTNGSTQQWAYNSHPSATGSVFATEDDGIAPVTIFWAMFKKGVQGWFFWESAYWTDSNMDGLDTNIFTDATTFGFDTSSNTTKGRTGAGYSNGDGVLMYPGKDISAGAQVNYGFDGPIASWRLKMLRRGIQDGDYITQAYAVDPAATMDIVETMVPRVLWEQYCFEPGDCTYAYGGRSWSNDPDDWETARESLIQLFDAPTSSFSSQGTVTLKGGATVK